MPNDSRMDWSKLLLRERYGTPRLKYDDDIRSPYQADLDRIIFSSHFRRLGRKTQVHPLNENDHLHSRLSHSIETGSVGRSLGQYVGDFLRERGELPEGATVEHLGQIVQAACLAHDIGNPPFGHSGEAAIKSWFKDNAGRLGPVENKHLQDLQRFDGNAMSFRILVRTGFGESGTGMRPTLPVLGALMKYPTTSEHATKDKFSVLQSEAAVLEEVAERLGLLGEPGRYARHPLAYLTEAADDICYRIIDLEDATEVGILDGGYILRQFAGPLGISKEEAAQRMDATVRPRNSRLRAAIIANAIAESVQAFKDNYEAIMAGELEGGLTDVAAGPVCGALMGVYKEASKDIFLSKRKVELEIGAQRSLAILLDTFIGPAMSYCGDPSEGHRARIKALLGEAALSGLGEGGEACPYSMAILVMDYLTGMTDQYATRMCRKFLGIGG